jgi:hypothetical protein
MHAVHVLALSLWAACQAPLVALAASLLFALAARALRLGPLAAATAGIGAVAGFCALGGWAWPPPATLQRLAPAAAAATIAAVAQAAWLPRARIAAGALTALLGGWFLAGTPLHLLPSLRWVEAAGMAAALAVGALGLGALGAGQVVLASVSLGCGLSAAHVSHAWVLAALVPGAALIGASIAGVGMMRGQGSGLRRGAALRGGPAAASAVTQPVALAVAAVAAACVLSAGDLQRLRPRPLEAAALAPVLAVWLAARLAPRLHVAAGGIGLAAATLLVWMIAGGR